PFRLRFEHRMSPQPDRASLWESSGLPTPTVKDRLPFRRRVLRHFGLAVLRWEENRVKQLLELLRIDVYGSFGDGDDLLAEWLAHFVPISRRKLANRERPGIGDRSQHALGMDVQLAVEGHLRCQCVHFRRWRLLFDSGRWPHRPDSHAQTAC